MAIKAVLFDHDGTLVNSEIVHYQLWRDLLLRYQVQFDEMEYRQFHVGIPCEDNAALLIKDHNLQVSAQLLVAEKHQAVKQYQQQHGFPLMADVESTLLTLKQQQFVMAVVSGSDHFAVQSSIKFHHLNDFFSCVATGDQVEKNKPAPDVYQLAMTQLGLTPSECIAVEDTENGMKSALAAGLTCLVIPNEYSQNHSFTGATAILPSINHVIHWLEQHNG